ncbi:MAG: isoprenylcysteine carboxylmethyltransferase family protein [Pirellulales bacterium]|nr:isoprenylcysteine carboxylmethyltransferase family protein [Pirellulales bacterium]
MKAMNIWGVGPALVGPAIIVAVAAGAATYLWPELFSLDFLPYPLLAAMGITMIVASVPIFVLSGRTITRAYSQGRLATTGPYAVCRNPLYANWILLLLPGIALLSNSWLMLAAPVALYIAVRMQIHLEEEYLEKQFGEEFIEYRKRTNAVFPTVCRRR